MCFMGSQAASCRGSSHVGPRESPVKTPKRWMLTDGSRLLQKEGTIEKVVADMCLVELLSASCSWVRHDGRCSSGSCQLLLDGRC